MAKEWTVRGQEEMSEFSGTYDAEELDLVLEEAWEAAPSEWHFDQLLEGESDETGVLSGSELIAARDLFFE